jgi:hypothetical protein
MGGIASTPVINRPEVATVAVNKVRETVVVVDGDLEIAKLMNLSLSCDHRVVDGWNAALFMQDLKTLIESRCASCRCARLAETPALPLRRTRGRRRKGHARGLG